MDGKADKLAKKTKDFTMHVSALEKLYEQKKREDRDGNVWDYCVDEKALE